MCFADGNALSEVLASLLRLFHQSTRGLDISPHIAGEGLRQLLGLGGEQVLTSDGRLCNLLRLFVSELDKAIESLLAVERRLGELRIDLGEKIEGLIHLRLLRSGGPLVVSGTRLRSLGQEGFAQMLGLELLALDIARFEYEFGHGPEALSDLGRCTFLPGKIHLDLYALLHR